MKSLKVMSVSGWEGGESYKYLLLLLVVGENDKYLLLLTAWETIIKACCSDLIDGLISFSLRKGLSCGIVNLRTVVIVPLSDPGLWLVNPHHHTSCQAVYCVILKSMIGGCAGVWTLAREVYILSLIQVLKYTYCETHCSWLCYSVCGEY